ncbi:hypothetical protein ACFY1S_24145 [Micromonospora sp. NPDC000663]|uniref:hypothetical protein n=1 Tax=Micromonospora sp. NPDC000663 TaxID=3364218 RepID=UPI00368E6281
MAVRPEGAAEARTARLLASVPWVVVLLGVCVLVALLVVALLSFRTREKGDAPRAAPPVFLPTAPAAVSPTGGPTPTGVERRTVSPRPSRSSRAPSPRVATASPSPGRGSAPAVASTSAKTVSARYEVGTDGRDGTEAVLSVTNSTGQSVDWRVELAYDGDVRALRVNDDSGVSVWGRGDGEFVLRGTRSLAPGDTRTVRLRLGWGESGSRPLRCAVNGLACRLG